MNNATTDITMERVLDFLSGRNIIATQIGDQPPVAVATVDDVPISFIIIGRHLIVRSDISHHINLSNINATREEVGDDFDDDRGDKTDKILASWIMAANEINMAEELPTATILETDDAIVARLETEFDCEAGINDIQLNILVGTGIVAVTSAAVALEHVHSAYDAAATQAGN